MALSIRDPETDRLAHELAQRTGETMTQAIRTALAEPLARLDDKHGVPSR
jgi:antitoxin VapB